ncbi:PadR family transcriptional regulator [Cellulomonas sp. PhB143]|uniref:PadR family transcriptional regulator n=1 Tax=Cellulomonas sp. PhB143 TaxID=2485186 RepID=UPI000F4A45E9|nr:helix-turn-helix transcriptional regulator [Cellulomonas sp. PhB143]ROS76896.1 PadR family transcriptional regulator [Cellulomonas sp. PhB143]
MGTELLTPVATLVLSVLSEGPNHPYEILATLRKRGDDRLVRLNAGAVYHAVEKLGSGGYVRVVGVEQEGNRPARTTYAVTPAGAEALVRRVGELVADPTPEYPRFPVGLSMLDELDADEAARLLHDRREATAERARGLRARVQDALGREVPRRYLLDALLDIEIADAQVRWLDTTVAELRSGALDWHDERRCPHRTTQETS